MRGSDVIQPVDRKQYFFLRVYGVRREYILAGQVAGVCPTGGQVGVSVSSVGSFSVIA